MMKRCLLLLFMVCALGVRAKAQERTLDIYFVDTEGGAATLIVTPTNESILIDTGNPGTRDANRIAKVAKEVAHLTSIDHLLTTHWHLDHYGGVEELNKIVPIRHYYDRGIPAKTLDDPEHFPALIAAYRKASKSASKTVKAGDILLSRNVNGSKLSLKCLVASGKTVSDNPGAKANPFAQGETPMAIDTSDNAQSLGVVLQFGDFRFLDMGDLTWNVEYKLVSPTDKVGLIDVYQATHHGLEISNNPALINTVQPRVAVFNNGPHKGAHPSVMATLRNVPGIEAIYQQHRNLDSKPEDNASKEYIANEAQECDAEYIRISVAPDGKSYTVTVGSKGTPKRYQTRTR